MYIRITVKGFTWSVIGAAMSAMALAGSVQAAELGSDYWRDSNSAQRPAELDGANHVRLLSLDVSAFKRDLAKAGTVATSVLLPDPDGGFSEFALRDSETLPPELAARYPEIRSLIGVDRDGHQARIDVSPLGVNAMVFAHDGIWVVRPMQFGEGTDYISLRRADLTAPAEFKCGIHETSNDHVEQLGANPSPQAQTGALKRNYRAAVVGNHFYTQAVTGSATPTVAQGLAAVVLAVNRVNQVYETDFAIHMTLIPNNDVLIFPDAVTDTSFGTASDNNGDNLNTFTSKITAIIGVGNYDIGHVFTTGSGGVAGLGVVCKTTSKGRGTTGLTNGASLASDTFYIDYVAHEMGHQFGGNHTFNGTNSSCGGSNRSASAAYEPGSGSTIMAYAGICGGANNLQPHSDPYFHAKSLDEINIYESNTTTGGGSCGATQPNNIAPVLTVPAPVGGAYIIPARTPFEISGSAVTSSPGSVLTYTWEQYDLGAANNTLTSDPATGPITRSYNPVLSPTRSVPKLTDLSAGTSTFGDILPTTNRTLTYRLTARDNVPGGGTSDRKDLLLTVVDNVATVTYGPFVVTAPLATAGWIYGGGLNTAPVAWNVANTDLAPVSCASVKADLSLDSGLTYPVPLLANAPNNGTATVFIPNVQTNRARVRVSCANNVFFNISPADFSITGTDILFQNGFQP
ncbi:MAG: reprolysin-like metallopeptidase [Tahibacter sp.]